MQRSIARGNAGIASFQEFLIVDITTFSSSFMSTPSLSLPQFREG